MFNNKHFSKLYCGDRRTCRHLLVEASVPTVETDTCSVLLAVRARTLDDEASAAREREKLVRKLEICAAVRAQSARKMSHRCSQREVVKNQMLAERRRHHERIYSSAREREDRWSRRLHRTADDVTCFIESCNRPPSLCPSTPHAPHEHLQRQLFSFCVFDVFFFFTWAPPLPR